MPLPDHIRNQLDLFPDGSPKAVKSTGPAEIYFDPQHLFERDALEYRQSVSLLVGRDISEIPDYWVVPF